MRLLFSTILIGFVPFIAKSQSDPSLVSYSVDTVCEGSYGNGVYNLIVEDLDFDSTYINIISYNTTLIDYVYVFDVPYNPGATTRTFTFEISAAYGLPAGVSLSNIDIEIVGGSGDDFTTFETLLNIGVRKGPSATMDLSSLQLCTNSQPLNLMNYVSPQGGIFQFGSHTTDGYFLPLDFYNDSGDGIYYIYTDAYGCEAVDNDYPSIATPPQINMIANESTCGNADGSAIATITGDIQMFDVYWTNGFAQTVSGTSIANNLKAGTYYMTATDLNGCIATAIAQISDGDLDITETITDETCIGSSFNGSIEVDILSTNGTVNLTHWQSGQNTEDIYGLTAGDYILQVGTNTGCKAFKTYTVAALPKLEVDPYWFVMAADCFAPGGIGNSGIDITTIGGSGLYTWAWNNGQTSEDLNGIPSGIYDVLITDAVTGCTYNFSANVDDINGPDIYIDKITQANCNQNNGAIDAGIYAPAPIISLGWNNGALTEDLNNIPAGTYTLTAVDINGCMASEKVIVKNNRPYQPEICLLTVDTSLIYNQVVWEKQPGQNVLGFNVYRESTTVGTFNKVSTRPYGLESFYEDNAASPNDRSWRYYITSFDACGTESYPSFIHKTIHVVANTSNGIDYNLSWDKYEGIAYSSVDLFRFDATNGWTSIGNFPYGTTTALDTPPVLSDLDYMVSFNLSSPCTSSKAQDHNSSRSNKTASIFNPGGSTAALQDDQLGFISIFPNPTNSQVTLHVDQPELFNQFEILDINGRVIANGIIYSNNTLIDLDDFDAGVYLIHLQSENKTIVQRIVKN